MAKLNKKANVADENDKSSADEVQDEEEKQMFLNPLLAFKNAKDAKGSDESEQWSDDDKYDPKETKE